VSLSASPSASPSVSISVSPSVSLSVSPSVSPSASPSVVTSFSPSVSPSLSPSISPSPSPGYPDRYWIGGTGNWSDTDHWSYTSGGSGGATLPDSTKNVFIDENSGFGSGGTITLDYNSVYADIHDLTCSSGHTYSINKGGSGTSYGMWIGGSLTLERI
jgi:hypothetical protein